MEVHHARVFMVDLENPGTLAKVLKDRAMSNVLVHILPGKQHAVVTAAWSPVPLFGQPVGHSSLPVRGARIVCTASGEPSGPLECIQWAPADLWAQGVKSLANPQPMRLVKLRDGQVVQILWQAAGYSSNPCWQQVVEMSGRFPRLEDQSDDISKSYKNRPTVYSITDGLVFQTLIAGKWLNTDDLRQPDERQA